MTDEKKSRDCYNFPKDYAATMVHFYRGEPGRMMIWRPSSGNWNL